MPALAMIIEFFRKPAMLAPGMSKLITSSATARIVASGCPEMAGSVHRAAEPDGLATPYADERKAAVLVFVDAATSTADPR